MLGVDMSCRWSPVSSFWRFVTKMFVYIILKSKSLCECVVCVLFMWLVGVVCWVFVMV